MMVQPILTANQVIANKTMVAPRVAFGKMKKHIAYEAYFLLCLVLACRIGGARTPEYPLYYDRPADRYGNELCRK